MGNAYRSVLALKPTGDAVPANVLAGKTFSNADGTGKTGTMANNGAVSVTLTDQDPTYTIPEGYHNGNGTVTFSSSGGDGADLIVSCSATFAGSTISCTDGTTTYTQICPSTSPYSVTFESIPTGIWTISGIVSEQTFSTTITILDFETTLNAAPEGLTVTPTDDIQTWLHCATIWDKTYTSLSQVLADSSTLLALISNNNAVDYMARSTTWANDVASNSSAMNYIGLNDYCAFALLGNSSWHTAICNSNYFESVLNVKVPTMTSQTTPSGYAEYYKLYDGTNYLTSGVTLGSSSTGTSTYYIFDEPVAINMFEFATLGSPNVSANLLAFTAKIEISDDGSTWDEIGSHSWTVQQHIDTYKNPTRYILDPNVRKARYVRFRTTNNNYTLNNQNVAGMLQFYGRG